MKKNVLTKAAAIMAATAVCFSGGLSVMANTGQEIKSQAEDEAVLRYHAIMTCYNLLELKSGGKLNCQGRTEVQNGYTAGLVVELQKQNGNKWSTIKSWSDSGLYIAMLTKEWYVVRGTYRLQLTHKAINSNGSVAETVVKYSDTIKY